MFRNLISGGLGVGL
jgi:hypothetical protein